MLCEQVRHAVPLDARYAYEHPAYVHSLHFARNAVYSEMEGFADVVVHVPPGATAAEVRARRAADVRRPPRWLGWWSAAELVLPTAVLVGAIEHIGPMGPAAAAAWLGLRWWLH